MVHADWTNGFAKSLGVYLSGHNVDTDEKGQPIHDSDFFLASNAYYEPVPFQLPPAMTGQPWRCILDTHVLTVIPELPRTSEGAAFSVPGHSLLLWECVRPT